MDAEINKSINMWYLFIKNFILILLKFCPVGSMFIYPLVHTEGQNIIVLILFLSFLWNRKIHM